MQARVPLLNLFEEEADSTERVISIIVLLTPTLFNCRRSTSISSDSCSSLQPKWLDYCLRRFLSPFNLLMFRGLSVVLSLRKRVCHRRVEVTNDPASILLDVFFSGGTNTTEEIILITGPLQSAILMVLKVANL